MILHFPKTKWFDILKKGKIIIAANQKESFLHFLS